jgi:cell division protein FtsL
MKPEPKSSRHSHAANSQARPESGAFRTTKVRAAAANGPAVEAPKDSHGAESTVNPSTEQTKGAKASRAVGESFLLVWGLSMVAVVAALCVYLTLRGKILETGYELGRVRGEQSRLRETRRVLELEAASYKNPARIELLSRTLLGMERPTAERIITLPSGTWLTEDAP